MNMKPIVIISSRHSSSIKALGPFETLADAQKYVLFCANEDRKDSDDMFSDSELQEELEDNYHEETAKNIYDITELRWLT